MKFDPEVRYHMLRPSEIVTRREASSVAYIPVGTLEWHGPHNPVGADTLQAEGLAILAAQKGGGLVFPSLYYGESRLESLMEANAGDRDKIAEQMHLSPDNFTPPRFLHTPMQQTDNYQQLLLHILAEVMSLGFKLGVLVAGHYPLIDHCRAAVLRFNKWRPARYGGMLAWACLDYTLVQDRWGKIAGDHAGGWETSHLLHLYPDRVDVSTLPPKGQPLIGVNGALPPQDATAEFGAETLEASAEIVIKEVQHRLNHPDIYHKHGMSLAEGLWRDSENN